MMILRKPTRRCWGQARKMLEHIRPPSWFVEETLWLQRTQETCTILITDLVRLLGKFAWAEDFVHAEITMTVWLSVQNFADGHPILGRSSGDRSSQDLAVSLEGSCCLSCAYCCWSSVLHIAACTIVLQAGLPKERRQMRACVHWAWSSSWDAQKLKRHDSHIHYWIIQLH